MTPDDRTQPASQPPAPRATWPQYDAPTVTPRALAQRRSGRGLVWGVLGFLAGCILTAVVALALLAPSPAPNTPAQTHGAALSLTLTDTLLTQSLGSNLGAGAASIGQAHAHIQANGQVVISGVWQGPIATGTPVTVVVQPYVSQNTLAIQVVSAGIDGLALPPAALTGVSDQINQSLAQSSHISLGTGQTLVVSGVSFADGAMTLSYVPATS